MGEKQWYQVTGQYRQDIHASVEAETESCSAST